jgi:replicative DNA helicase
VTRHEESPQAVGASSDNIAVRRYPEGTPPHLYAEAAVLGAAILSADARTTILDRLEPDDFDHEAHRVIFETLREMDGPPDVVTVTLHLCDTGRIDQAGGYAAVVDLVDPVACPSPSSWRHYVAAVRQAADRRRAIAYHLAELRGLGVGA